MAGGPVRRRDAGGAGKFGQNGMIDRKAAFGEEGHLDQKARRGNQRMRAGMDFAERRSAQIMRRKPQDRRLRQTDFFRPSHAQPRIFYESVRSIVHCGTSANAPQDGVLLI